MIKSIQLRGISRTPSDRLSEDGGLSESLNMYLDTAESAPALVPEEVEGIKLPVDLQAERIFIHKTANFENVIYVELSDDGINQTIGVALNGRRNKILVLDDYESVNDITSVGNTVIISTSKHLYYILNKYNKYELLGTKVPFPMVNFVAKYENSFAISSGFSVSAVWDTTEEEWNDDLDYAGEHNNEDIRSGLNLFWTKFDEEITKQAKDDLFFSPVFIRYTVKLFNGIPLSSMPILLNPTNASVVCNITAEKGMQEGQYGELEPYETCTTQSPLFQAYKIKATLQNLFELEDWKDVIESIDIYISTSLYKHNNRNISRLLNKTEVSGDDFERKIASVDFAPNKDHFFSASALTYKVKQCLLTENISEGIKGGWSNDIQKLSQGFEFGPQVAGEDVDILTLPLLSGDDMKHYETRSKKLDVFNKKLILIQPSQIIGYDYNSLNAYEENNIRTSDTTDYDLDINYNVQFLLRGVDGDRVVTAGPFLGTEKVHDGHCIEKNFYGFQTFPDKRAYKMVVITRNSYNQTKTQEFDMVEHPYLDCAVFADNPSTPLHMLVQDSGYVLKPENRIDDNESKIMVSSMESPFSFPINETFPFQAKVIGVAIATTALSQGQFGQYPLYVFTEDGIWTMGTAADGTFVSPKPLSREVCVNPESICPIDNAVVFVTNKAVMLLQGSEAINLSAFMNGKHYVPNESAMHYLDGEGGYNLQAIIDETPFMEFMKKASTAYDYSGQRLIFIAPDEKYQYIYKIDTQTWHKISFPLNVISPINSYPECYIQGTKQSTQDLCFVTGNSTQASFEEIKEDILYYCPGLNDQEINDFLYDFAPINITHLSKSEKDRLVAILRGYQISTEYRAENIDATKLYDFSTSLDVSKEQQTAKGILITRPMDFAMPDVFKSLTKVKIRGDFSPMNVKIIIQGSNNGRDFYTLSSLRGQSWKMFRFFILADLEPTERVSWIDVDYEPRHQNKLR